MVQSKLNPNGCLLRTCTPGSYRAHGSGLIRQGRSSGVTVSPR
jgi:hypothetical protein